MSRRSRQIKRAFALSVAISAVLLGSCKPSEEQLKGMVSAHAMKCGWRLDGKVYSSGLELSKDNLNLSVISAASDGKQVAFSVLIAADPFNQAFNPLSNSPARGTTWSYAGKWNLKSGGWEIDEAPTTITLTANAVR